jgi:hypothetical protein
MKKIYFSSLMLMAALFATSCSKDASVIQVRVPQDRESFTEYPILVRGHEVIHRMFFRDRMIQFAADADANLIGVTIYDGNKVIVDRRRFGNEWKSGVREEQIKTTFNIDEWSKLFYSKVSNPKVLIQNEHEPISLGDEEGPRLWEVVGKLEDDPKTYIIRTPGVTEVRKVHENQFGLLPKGDKPFYIVKQNGLLYPVIRMATEKGNSLYVVEVMVNQHDVEEVASK